LSAVIPPPQGSGGEAFDTNNPSFTGLATFEELEVTTEVNINATEIGITASTTQSQGEGPLTSTYNEVGTVANENDVVTLPDAVQGITVIVRNSGANTLQVFPASGDLFLTRGANDPFFIPINSTAYFSCLNNVSWSVTSEAGFDKEVSINFIIDGGGTEITTGIKGDIEIPFDCTIERVTILADQIGSIVVDIFKDTFANYPPVVGDSITASAKPTISTDVKSQDTTLTGWTTSIVDGDTLRYNVDSVTDIERVTIALKCRRP